jgi:hypothetical protein
LQHDARIAASRGPLDEMTVAHLEALETIAGQALSAQATTSP